MKSSSEKLYKELLSFVGEIKEFTKNVATYPSQLSFAGLNHECYCEMYLVKKDGVKPRQEFFEVIPKLKSECGSCWKYYLNPRNKSVIGLDVQLGKKYQEAFSNFLNSKEITCCPADKSNKKYPDLMIMGQLEKYIELKYQSSPFIFAYKQSGRRRECYEGSAALDVKKLVQQRELKESGKLNSSTYYVFWLDFPCVKGVFYMTLEEIWAYYQSGAEIFQRKVREGDYAVTSKGVKMSAEINKIHPSIYQMHSFEELLNILE